MAEDDWVTVHIKIDRALIDSSNDPMEIIDPVWWLANFYDGPEVYEASLKRFSRPQRLVWAVEWYLAETHNGGHDQFYSNSTGAVWRDALAGLSEIGLADVASILRESADRLGGSPSLDRDARNDELEAAEFDFEDLDSRLFESDGVAAGEARIMTYIRAHADDFLFEDDVRRPPPILPPDPGVTPRAETDNLVSDLLARIFKRRS